MIACIHIWCFVLGLGKRRHSDGIFIYRYQYHGHFRSFFHIMGFDPQVLKLNMATSLTFSTAKLDDSRIIPLSYLSREAIATCPSNMERPVMVPA